MLGLALLCGHAQADTTVTIGSGTESFSVPMLTFWMQGRTQVIYLASEIGTAGNITSLALDVTTAPGQTLNNWTIRIKHTALAAYVTPAWEDSGWTTVYQANTTAGTGWCTFTFTTPFAYNGTDNLLVDFSFDNSGYGYSSYGYCRYSIPGGNRTAYYYRDSGSAPLTWSGTTPTPNASAAATYVPNLRLTLAQSTTYSVSGSITCGGSALAGVTVTPAPSGSAATTDASGNYTISGLAAGTYAVTPAKTGYTFAPPSITGITVGPNATDEDFTATANSYLVTFETQGGTAASPASISVTYDAAYGDLATTARPGYTFGGWWTDAGGTATEVTAATPVTITAPQTLYAKWLPNPYLVTFNAQGGTNPNPATKLVTYGSAYGTLATTTRPGYTFAGWWTGATGTGTEVTASTIVATAANQTLYAKYLALPIQITTTSAFTGTVTVAANWVDFSVLDADDTNCNDWVAFPVKYTAYLVLCYGDILCPVCPFDIADAWLWLVDKRGKQVFMASLEDGGITDAQGYCFGGGNVGVTFTTFLPYADLDGQTGTAYTTSTPVVFALAGARAKANASPAAAILRLDGGAMVSVISPTENSGRLTALECDNGSELAVVTAAFRKNQTKIKPDPWCPECATDCEELQAAQAAVVAKTAKKYLWWDILGESSVEPANR